MAEPLIECVFFDAAGTVIYPEPSVGEVYASTARRFGVEAPVHEVEEAFLDGWRRLKLGHDGETPPYGSTDAEARAWWRRYVEDTFSRWDVTDMDGLFEELYTYFAQPSAWRVFPDFPPTAVALKERGVRIGLVSNWDLRLRGIVRGLELASVFDPLVISAEVGREKPASAIFREALRLSGVAAARALHVGDSVMEDVEGARRAGIRPVRIVRDEDADAALDCTVIRDLRELLDLV